MAISDLIAPPDSLLGLLQRGRGEGYRRILTVSPDESHAILLECILHDPRLDSQVESRDRYYASIAIEINLPLEPLANHLREHDDQNQGSSDSTLTVTTLAELAKRNHRNAQDILSDYIQWGQWWNWPLDDLLNLSKEDLSFRIARAIEHHFPSESALDEAVLNWPTEAFTKLSHYSSRIEASITKASPKLTPKLSPTLPDLSLLSSQQLLSLANKDNYREFGKQMARIVKSTEVESLVSHVSFVEPYMAHVALAGLAQLAHPSVFPCLVNLWTTIAEEHDPNKPGRTVGQVILRRGISRAVIALPGDITLPLARDWISQRDPWKTDLAEKILEHHATVDDLPLLREALIPMLSDEDKQWRCFLIKAFHHLPNIGVIPELLDVFSQFRFSKGREYAAEAIQITSPDLFRDKLAFECLWDCEEGTRAFGAKSVSLDSDEARNRLEFLANDLFDEKETRSEAQKRLQIG